MTVNKARVVELYTLLKQYKLFGFCNTENVTNKGEPKGLAIAFFVATVFPIFRKGFRRLFLSASVIAIIDLSSAK